MPQYLNISGKIIRTYSPDGFTRIDIIDREYEYVYKVVPIKLSNEEQLILKRVMDELSYILKPSELTSAEKMEEVLRKRGLSDKLVYLIKSEIVGYSWLEPLMRDDNLEDIQCFHANVPLRVTHKDYGLIQTNIIPSDDEVDRMVRILAHRGGSGIHRSRPILDSVILPTGDRAALTYRSEVSPTSSFTIRKFPRYPWTPTRMMLTHMISPEAMALLWLAIEAKLPIIIFGEMGSGKTSLANALGCLIKPTASITLVQDVPEMRIPHENLISLSERKSFTVGSVGEIKLDSLVAHALRRSTDYLIVNEVRYAEARAFAQHVATGHGGITSFHAGSLNEVYSRFKELGIEESTMSSVKVLIQTIKVTSPLRGSFSIARRVKSIFYITGLRNYVPIADIVFDYDPAKDTLTPLNIRSTLEEVSRRLLVDMNSLLKEYEQRKIFMTLALEAARYGKYLRAEEWFILLRKYYHSPKNVLNELRAHIHEIKTNKVRASINYKTCPKCNSRVDINKDTCPSCGYDFVNEKTTFNNLGKGVSRSMEGLRR